MQTIIYEPHDDTPICTVPNIMEGSIEKRTLMADDYIELHFTLAEAVYFPVGAYTEWNGRRFEVTAIQQPTYDTDTGGWTYELRMEAYYMAWKNRIFKYVPQIGGSLETSFSLTWSIETHVRALVNALAYEGFTFGGKAITYAIEGTPDLDYKDDVVTISYEDVSLLDAVSTIASQFETEWWVEDEVLHFGKCQRADSTQVDFRLGENVELMESSKTDQDYATRVWAFGGTNNMPRNRNKGEAVFKVESIGATAEGDPGDVLHTLTLIGGGPQSATVQNNTDTDLRCQYSWQRYSEYVTLPKGEYGAERIKTSAFRIAYAVKAAAVRTDLPSVYAGVMISVQRENVTPNKLSKVSDISLDYTGNKTIDGVEYRVFQKSITLAVPDFTVEADTENVRFWAYVGVHSYHAGSMAVEDTVITVYDTATSNSTPQTSHSFIAYPRLRGKYFSDTDKAEREVQDITFSADGIDDLGNLAACALWSDNALTIKNGTYKGDHLSVCDTENGFPVTFRTQTEAETLSGTLDIWLAAKTTHLSGTAGIAYIPTQKVAEGLSLTATRSGASTSGNFQAYLYTARVNVIPNQADLDLYATDTEYKLLLAFHFDTARNCTINRASLAEKQTWMQFADIVDERYKAELVFFTDVAQLQTPNSTPQTQEATYNATQGYLTLTGGTTPTEGAKFVIRNILSSKLPTSYFEESTIKSEANIKAITEDRLTLPDPGYIELGGSGLRGGEIVEKVLVFDDIYPRTKSKITDVQTATFQQTVEYEDETVKEDYTGYFIKTDSFTFDDDYQLRDDENLKVKFQTGALAGLTFECTFGVSTNNAKNEVVKADGQYFLLNYTEVATDYWLPAASQIPKVGDEFVLIGWDTTRLEDMNLIEKAQAELREETEKELRQMAVDPNTYDCTMMSDYIYGLDADGNLDSRDGHTWNVGHRVRLYSDAYFKGDPIMLTDTDGGQLATPDGEELTARRGTEGYRDSRIMGYERKIDSVAISGESSSRLNTGGTGSSTNGSTGTGGTRVTLITTDDATAETDANAYSALRARQEFLSRKRDDTAQGQLTLSRGSVHQTSVAYADLAETAADGIIEDINT